MVTFNVRSYEMQISVCTKYVNRYTVLYQSTYNKRYSERLQENKTASISTARPERPTIAYIKEEHYPFFQAS